MLILKNRLQIEALLACDIEPRGFCLDPNTKSLIVAFPHKVFALNLCARIIENPEGLPQQMQKIGARNYTKLLAEAESIFDESADPEFIIYKDLSTE